VIQAVRLAGVVLVILGLMLTQGALDLAGDANAIVGYVFLAAGLLDVFVMPVILSRRWSSRGR
jgi:hypothetical protein